MNATAKEKYTNLNYLKQLTEGDTILIEEMIRIYLRQTPLIIDAMKESLVHNDWQSLQEAIHKIIPSFSIMGIGYDIESIARRIQKYEYSLTISKEIQAQVFELETICEEAFKELEAELKNIKENTL
ncbi:Hpt domain-containing protein [Flavobacterium limnosediminis]|uniref:Hpt domain-containing protein n=1 Tax=Flavobacterium limnosediminis TaxID=1401027 RepID=UPI000407F647|nr:Hpt domain-containing protein [Flavobacterium limnosediminis]